MPNKPSPADRLLVVLDLDETLLHSASQPLARPADFRIGPFHAYKRPGVDGFLKILLNDTRFAVVLSTWGNRRYALGAVAGLGIFPIQLQRLFSRECVTQYGKDVDPWGTSDPYGAGPFTLTRDLQKVIKGTDWALDRTIAVDDNDTAFHPKQHENLLHVQPYKGGVEPQPDLFPSLLDTLRHLVVLQDVRSIDKRGWFNNRLRRQADHSSPRGAALL